MTRIGEYWREMKLLVAVGLLLVVAGFVGAQVQSRVDGGERELLIGRFPKVRADAAASATEVADAKYAVEMKGIKSENETLKSSQALLATSVQDTHNLVVDMRKFMGERAALNDKRNAQLQKKTAVAADAAVDAKQTAQVAEQKATVAAAKIEETASAVKSVDKKLETVQHPTLPPRPWAGSTGGH